MEEQLTKKYMKTLGYILNNIINFKEIDKMASDDELLLVKTEEMDRNLDSDFFTCRNELNIKKLTEEERKSLLKSEEVDDSSLEVVFKTLPEILRLDDKKTITYDYVLPDRMIPNGYLVLDFEYCIDQKNKTNEEAMKAIQIQEKMITQLKNTIPEEINKILGIECRVLDTLKYDNIKEEE